MCRCAMCHSGGPALDPGHDLVHCCRAIKGHDVLVRKI